MRATWQKLEDGSWGVRVEAQQMGLLHCLAGQEIEVTRRDGSKSLERVTKVVATYTPRSAKRVGRREIKAIPLPVAVCLVVPKPSKRARKGQPAPELVAAYEQARLEARRGLPSMFHAYADLRAELTRAKNVRIEAEETEREYEQERLYG